MAHIIIVRLAERRNTQTLRYARTFGQRPSSVALHRDLPVINPPKLYGFVSDPGARIKSVPKLRADFARGRALFISFHSFK